MTPPTKHEYPRSVDQIMKVSNSALTAWTDCGEKFRLQYLEGAPRIAQGPLIGGIAVHETVEQGYRQKWFAEGNKDALYADLEERIMLAVEEAGGADKVRWGGRKTAAEPNGNDYDFWLGPKPKVWIDRAQDLFYRDIENGMIVWPGRDGEDPDAGLEMWVSLPLGNRTITGRIDALMIDTGTGEGVIRDYATGQPGGKTPLQGTLYALATEATVGVTVSRVQYVYLKGASERVMIQEFDPEPLREIIVPNFEAFVRGIEASAFAIKPSSFCTSCAVKQSCAYGKTLN